MLQRETTPTTTTPTTKRCQLDVAARHGPGGTFTREARFPPSASGHQPQLLAGVKPSASQARTSSQTLFGDWNLGHPLIFSSVSTRCLRFVLDDPTLALLSEVNPILFSRGGGDLFISCARENTAFAGSRAMQRQTRE